jgi:hypothetical protein
VNSVAAVIVVRMGLNSQAGWLGGWVAGWLVGCELVNQSILCSSHPVHLRTGLLAGWVVARGDAVIAVDACKGCTDNNNFGVAGW